MATTPTSMEIKSALWQKIFAFALACFFGYAGVFLLVMTFVPSLPKTANAPMVPPSPIEQFLGVLIGLALLISGFLLWWTVHKYSIKADEQGITQTNGFFHQTVRWDNVTSYYLALNRRHYNRSSSYIEPFLLGPNGELLFQSFADLLVSSERGLEQRRQFWRFVESHLEGKKIEAAARQFTPDEIAAKSLETDWVQKSPSWKIRRLVALTLYCLFWAALTFGPLYYYIVALATQPPKWLPALFPLSLFGPLIPHLIWIQWKRWQITKSIKQNNSTLPPLNNKI